MPRAVFHVSLTVLVPLIVAGAAVLTLFVSRHLPFLPHTPDARLNLAAALVGGVTFLVTAFLISLILRPVRHLLNTARKTGVLPASDPTSPTAQARSDMEEFRSALAQVGLALSRLDAKSLFPEIVGHGRAMRMILGQVMKVAPAGSSVLITGESGTGKELVAKAIHAQSPRHEGPLVIVNCAAIPETLLENELFGHEKGAFTGATAAKPGRFELAHTGTLFLDEIGDMPLALQAKILRMLESGTVERVGGVKPVRCDVRVIAATNRDLRDLMQRGQFREDLFHRLNVFPLHLPPLRDRREDIPVLADHFLAAGPDQPRVSAQALHMLMTHHWPGNVRELRNTLVRAALLAGQEEIRPEHLAGLPAGGLDLAATPDAPEPGKAGDPEPGTEANLNSRLAAMEKTMIQAALSRAEGVQAKAARILGIKERSLWHRIKKHGIDPREFK